jgi:hypothetical protein
MVRKRNCGAQQSKQVEKAEASSSGGRFSFARKRKKERGFDPD